MALFSSLIGKVKSQLPGSQASANPADPFKKQREQLSKSIIPGQSRLADAASEQSRQGATTAIGGAFGVGSETPMFQAEKEEEQTGRRFNRQAGQTSSTRRIAARNGLGAAFGRV